MKYLLSFFIFIVTFYSQIASAVEFTGEALAEDEIYSLWGKNNCKTFMVNSTSSKSAMPKILANYLNSDPSYQEIKIVTCKYKTIRIQLFLIQKESVWAMFSGEAVVFLPQKVL